MEIEDDEEVHRSESGGCCTEYCRCIKARYTAGYTNHKGDNSGVIEGKYRIRKLTPKECFRLQGWNYFDGNDTYFHRAEMVNSDSQLYKQAGNGVSVNVIEAIGKGLAEVEEDA